MAVMIQSKLKSGYLHFWGKKKINCKLVNCGRVVELTDQGSPSWPEK
jgi:hypothetical protein